MAPPSKRYAAFMSYSHSGSAGIAPALQHGLRALGRSWFRAPDLAIFRDNTGLAATPALWPTIERALADSRWLILLASPESAASPWVAKEVQWWLRHRSPHEILLVLTGGSIVWDPALGDFDAAGTTAIPKELLGAFDAEPLWVDLSWARTNERLSLRHSTFRECVAKLAAPIRGVSQESLLDEDVRQQHRMVRLRNLAATVLCVLTVVAAVSALVAVGQRDLARRQRDIAVSRQFAAESATIATTQPDLALLLAAEGVRHRSTTEAWAALQSALSTPMHPSWRLPGPTGIVSDVAFSPNGRLVASSGERGEVWVWRAADGARAIGPLPNGPGTVYSVAFNRDSSLVASGGEGGTVRVWQVSDGRPAFAPAPVSSPVNAVAFSPVADLLAAGDGDGNIRVWDTRTGRLTASALDDRAGVTTLTFTRDGGELIAGSFSGKVRRWRTTDLKPVGHTLRVGPATLATGVQSLAVNSSGDLLATVDAANVVRLWDLPSGRRHQPARIEAPRVNAVAFAPDGKTIATAGWKDAQLWDTATGRAVGVPFTGSTDYLLALAFSPDGRRLVTGGADHVPRIFDVAVRQPVGHAVVDTGYMYDFAVAPTGRTLAVGASGQVSVRDRSTGKLLAGPWPTVGGNSVAYSPDGSLVAFGDSRGAVRLRPVAATGGAARDLNTGFDVYAITFSPDGRTLYAAGFDDVVHSWDVATGRPYPDLKSPDDKGFSDLAVDPAGRYLAGATFDGPLELWQLPGGRLVSSLSRAGDKAASTAVAFAPDGRHLAQGTSKGAVRVWDVRSGAVTCVLAGHKSWVESAAFNPTGSLLATGSDDGSVRLWDPAACAPVGAPMLGFGDSIVSLAFAPDGRELLVGSRDGVVRGVAVPDRWLRQACELARRNLSRSEWAQYAVGAYRRTCPQWPAATK